MAEQTTAFRETDCELSNPDAVPPGGQHTGVVSSAVRVTHLPTGFTTTCREHRSQFRNKEQAMREMRDLIESVYHPLPSSGAPPATEPTPQPVFVLVDRFGRVHSVHLQRRVLDKHAATFNGSRLGTVPFRVELSYLATTPPASEPSDSRLADQLEAIIDLHANIPKTAIREAAARLRRPPAASETRSPGVSPGDGGVG